MLVLQTYVSSPWHSDDNFRKLEHAAVEWNKSSACDDGLFRFFTHEFAESFTTGAIQPSLKPTRTENHCGTRCPTL